MHKELSYDSTKKRRMSNDLSLGSTKKHKKDFESQLVVKTPQTSPTDGV